MSKLSKTEQKLLNRMLEHPVHGIYTYYQGTREANAAIKLEKAGLVKKVSEDGSYWYRTRMGYKKGYEPQGKIILVKNKNRTIIKIN